MVVEEYKRLRGVMKLDDRHRELTLSLKLRSHRSASRTWSRFLQQTAATFLYTAR